MNRSKPSNTNTGKKFLPNLFRKILFFLFLFILLGGIILLSIHFYIVHSVRNKLYSYNDSDLSEVLKDSSYDCILILGAGVWSGKPSPILKERLDAGLALYQNGAACKILVSGDHGSEYYDEVNVMKNYLIDQGVPSDDIFMDHAGFSTSDSMCRAAELFQVRSALVVTQKYHEYRSLYLAGSYGIDALGVSCDTQVFRGQTMRSLRELLAQTKDFLTVHFSKKHLSGNECIPITGSGSQTDDK